MPKQFYTAHWKNENERKEREKRAREKETREKEERTRIAQLAHNTLIVVPEAPEELKSTPFIDYAFGHKKVIRALQSRPAIKGYLIRGRLVKEPKNLQASNVARYNHGCVYIPVPNFNRMVLIKNVKIDKEVMKTVDLITSHICHQLKELNEKCDNFPKKVSVHIMLCMPEKEQSFNFKHQFNGNFNDFCERFRNLQLSYRTIGDNNLASKMVTFLNSNRNSDPVRLHDLILYRSQEKTDFRLNETEFICFNEKFCKLTEFHEISEMFERYFPHANENVIETVPNFDAIKASLLRGSNDEGRINPTEFAKIEGEHNQFRNLVQTLQKEPNANGIFLNSITEKKILQVIEPNSDFITLDQFEFDWTYVGQFNLVLFEISWADNPKSPIRCISNKINQAITKYIPFSDIILSTLVNAMPEQLFENTQKTEYFKILTKRTKIVVGFPLVDRPSSLGEIWLEVVKLIRDHQQYFQSCNEEKILLLFENVPNLYYIDKNLELREYEQNLFQLLFTPVSAEETKRMKFIQRFLTLSCLNLHCEITEQRREFCSVEERFLDCDESVDSKQSLSKNGCLNFFISPQQQKILRTNEQFVVLAGQPGCGKTSLLLSKAEIEAQNDAIENIVLFIPKAKKPFKRFIDDIVNKTGSEKLKEKFKLEELEDLEGFLKQPTIKPSTKHAKEK